MSIDYNGNRGGRADTASVTKEAVDVNAGLRGFMMQVYGFMSAGLAITGVVAYLTYATPSVFNLVYNTHLKWVVMFAPLGFVMYFSARLQKMSATTAQVVFLTFAAVMGMSLAYIFAVYTQTSIARVFFITSATFGTMSLYGYTTQRDLSGMGSFLFMGLIGIIIAGLVNIFLQSSAMQFAISVIGVLIFTGLTAYDTQNLKTLYLNSHLEGDTKTKFAVRGALSLYLNFINLFIMLLRLMGDRR